MDAARLFGRLADEQVDMVLVGGMAAIAHHVVHLTNDVDICYASEPARRPKDLAVLPQLEATLRLRTEQDL